MNLKEAVFSVPPPHFHREMKNLVKWSELGNTLKIDINSYDFFFPKKRGFEDIPM